MRDLEAYFRPESAEEAVHLKTQYGPEAVYLAGGSDLMVHRPRGVRAAIDIRHAGLKTIERNQDGYVIGGAATLREVEQALPDIAGGMLRQAVRETAPWLIRNVATLVGNLANASPAADAVPALVALDAVVDLAGPDGETVAAEEVPVAPHRTVLGDRLIARLRIPAAAAAWQGRFIKWSRSKSDIAQVNVAVALEVDNGVVRTARIALGAVAPTVMRARRAEAMLTGQVPDGALLRAVQAAVSEEVQPIDDWRASAAYRQRMSGVLTRRAIESVIGAGGEGKDASE